MEYFLLKIFLYLLSEDILLKFLTFDNNRNYIKINIKKVKEKHICKNFYHILII